MRAPSMYGLSDQYTAETPIVQERTALTMMLCVALLLVCWAVVRLVCCLYNVVSLCVGAAAAAMHVVVVDMGVPTHAAAAPDVRADALPGFVFG